MSSLNEWGSTTIHYPNGNDESMIQLISWWAGSVMKLKDDIETGLSLEDDPRGKLWHVYDLVGAYNIREWVQRCYEKVVDTYGPTRIALLEATDSLLKTFTEPDVRHVIRDARHQDQLPEAGAWWWDRIPTTGPVAEHARTFPDGGFLLENPGDQEGA